MGLNINKIHFGGVSHMSTLGRAELKCNLGGAKIGMQGWLETDGKKLDLELDNPVPINKARGRYIYRVSGYDKRLYKNPQYLILGGDYISMRKFRKSIKRVPATDEQRIDYFVNEYKVIVCSTPNLSTDNLNIDFETIKSKLKCLVANKNYDSANKYIDELIAKVN